MSVTGEARVPAIGEARVPAIGEARVPAIGSARAASAGFTLVEMLVVLGIGALIAGIGFPRLQGQIVAQEFRTGVAAVTALLRVARAGAIRSGRTTLVTAGDSGLRLGDAAPVALPDTVAVAVSGPVRFFGDGSASGGEIMVSSDGRRTRISVSAATGLLLARTP